MKPFQTPQYLFDRNLVGIQYSDVTGQWNVKEKMQDYGNTSCQHDLWTTGGKCLSDFGGLLKSA